MHLLRNQPKRWFEFLCNFVENVLVWSIVKIIPTLSHFNFPSGLNWKKKRTFYVKNIPCLKYKGKSKSPVLTLKTLLRPILLAYFYMPAKDGSWYGEVHMFTCQHYVDQIKTVLIKLRSSNIFLIIKGRRHLFSKVKGQGQT